MLGNPAFGIELSDGALKAVKLERRGARLVVTWADYRPYARAEDGAVRPRAGLNPRADATLRTFLAEGGPGPLDRVYVGFPSMATFNRLVMVPDVGDERLAEIARYETHRSLRGSIDDYVVRTHVLKKKADTTEIPALLYAARRSHLDAFVSDLSEAGLEFDNLVPSPAAIALFTRYDRPAKGDRTIVSIGLRATEIVYLRDRGHAFRTVPLGVIGLDAVGKGPARANAVKRLVAAIAVEIEKGARFFFDGGFRSETLSLFGEGAALAEVVWAFENHFPKVESIGSLHRLVIDDAVKGEVREQLVNMGSALGLAIAAARAADPHIELLPRNKARDAARRLPGLAAVSIAVSFCAWFAAGSDVAEADSVAALKVEPTVAEVAERRRAHAENLARLDRATSREARLRAYCDDRRPRATVLSSIVRLFGPEIAEFGDSDLRLLDLRVARADEGTEIRGEVRASLLDVRARTVLHQRLASIGSLASIEVAEVEGSRDEYAETVRLAFRGAIPEGGR
ncbi:MAG: hypothetical protein ACF8XB_22160 [Planctomycetota bacterium JB042]